MKKSRLLGVICALDIIILSNTVLAASFTPLGDLPMGSFYSVATGVSADGTVVVGQSNGDSGRHAFRWTSTGGMVSLGDFSGGGFLSIAQGVSADGSVIVGQGTSSTGDYAFRWSNIGGMNGIGTSSPSIAYDVSADGVVVIGIDSSAGKTEAFRKVIGESGSIGLGDLLGGFSNSRAFGVSANGEAVVGDSGTPSGSSVEAFLWTIADGMQGLGDLTGGTFESEARGISADGTVIVGKSNSDFGDEAFRWTNYSGMEGLGDLSGGRFGSVAKAVSENGSVIVGVGNSDIGPEAFRWTSEGGMQSISSLLTAAGIDLTGWTLLDASGVSNDGITIVGYGTNPDGNTEAWMAQLDLLTAPVISCVGPDVGIFNAPLDLPVTVNKRARVLPFSMMLIDEFGNALSDADIVPPILEVDVAPGNTVSAPPPETLESVGKGDDGNQFTFNGTKWGFNLKTKNFSGAGMYTATVVSGDPSSYVVDPTCAGTFYITR